MEKSQTPLVSVVLTTHNFEDFIDDAIESVLSQTLSDHELLIVDDDSTDRTVERIRAHRDDRINFVRGVARGAPATANEGLRRARGRYLAVWDGDDVWRPTKLARHVEAMEEDPALALTFSWCGLIDNQGQELGGGFGRWRGAISFSDLLTDFVIGTNSAVVFRREAVLAAGGFDPSLSHGYDMDLCLRLALVPGTVGVIEEELTLYRRHALQMSRDWRPIRDDWETILSGLRHRAPVEVETAEARARSNMQRYFAFLSYEARALTECLSLLTASFRAAPVLFLADARNVELLAACVARLSLPRLLVDRIEAAAVRRLRGGSPRG